MAIYTTATIHYNFDEQVLSIGPEGEVGDSDICIPAKAIVEHGFEMCGGEYRDVAEFEERLFRLFGDGTNVLFQRLQDLLPAVREMRAAQKEYFKTRSYQVLSDAKHAEREVDNILAMIDGVEEDNNQPKQGELL